MTDPAVEAAQRAWDGDRRYHAYGYVVAAREALAPLRELHKLTTDELYGRPGLICDDCDHDWPCPTAKLIYREDEL